MSTPTDLPLDELHSLRERAYGPTADIHADPAAMARLAELEAQARAVATPVPASEPDAASPAPVDVALVDPPAPVPPREDADVEAPFAEPLAPDAGTGIPAPATDAPAAQPSSATPWWRRRMPLLWAGSVVAALILGAGVTLAIESFESGAVAVLAPDPDAEWSDAIWGGPDAQDAIGFEEFFGLTVISQPQQWSSAGDTLPCMAIFGGEGDNIIYAGSGCGAGRFPAVTSFVVSRDSPKELRDRFPEGTALQFVLEDGRVHVYAEEPLVTPPTS